MKRVVAICVALGVLLQTISQVVIVAEYYAQKDYIAKNLCENRNKPQMHCDGKCCLKKRLAGNGKDQAPSSPRNQKNDQVQLFYTDISIGITHTLVAESPVTFLSRNDNRTSTFTSSVFHPPGIV